MTDRSDRRWSGTRLLLACGLAVAGPVVLVALVLAWSADARPLGLALVAGALVLGLAFGAWLAGRALGPRERSLGQLVHACEEIEELSCRRAVAADPCTDGGSEAPTGRSRDLGALAGRLRRSGRRLRTALAEGEKLRTELEAVLASREQEIRARTEELQAANLNLERQAREDGLTGIANHRRFVEFAEQCWRICIRERQPAAILMIDVDHFKAYNDIYGHQAGDQCLKKVSRAIREIARRPLDLAARYGGEEFALIFGHVGMEDALGLAEQARRAVESLQIPHSGSPDHGVVTISLGVASLQPERDTDVSTLIALADKALYRAKRNGRNRFER